MSTLLSDQSCSHPLLRAQAIGALEQDTARATCTPECRRARPVDPVVGDYDVGDFANRIDDVWQAPRGPSYATSCACLRGVASDLLNVPRTSLT